MHKIGLKLWSTNTDCYLSEAQRLYELKAYDYIELYIVPGTLNTLSSWKNLGIPCMIHCPHFAHGFNLADPAKHSYNTAIYEEVKIFANELAASYIIFHGGLDGSADETARQLKNLNEPRALIENKPYHALPQMNGMLCRGATPSEIRHIMQVSGCGFCLDIGHCICSANSQEIEPYGYIDEFNKLSPALYHLSDNDIKSEHDKHLHIGEGNYDISLIISKMLKGKPLALETNKSSKENLLDFIEDTHRINSRLISLTKMNEAKIRLTFEWTQNDELRRNFMMREKPVWEGHVEYFRKKLADPAQKAYAIEANGKHIGNCGLKNINEERAELWIYIGDRGSWGKGYGSQASKCLLNEARKLHLKSLYLYVLCSNIPARRMYDRMGFIPVRMNEEDRKIMGQLADSVVKMELAL